MAASPIVSCSQCPICKTYVRIPADLLASLTAPPAITTEQSARIVKPASYLLPSAKPARNLTAATLSSVETYSENKVYTIPPTPVILEESTVPTTDASAFTLTDHESSWRSRFLRMPVLIHGIVQIILTVLIIILEIASLGTSIYSATGAGIWCAIPFMSAGVSTVLLAWKWERSRLRATLVLISQLVLLVFSFILIGIVGSFVASNTSIFSSYTSTYTFTTTYGSNFSSKYQIMQAQLAFAVLLMFSGFAYVIFYGVVTYVALWKPFHTLDIPHLFRK